MIRMMFLGKKHSDATTCPTDSQKLSGFGDDDYADDDDDDDYEDDEDYVVVSVDIDERIGSRSPPPGLSPPCMPPGTFLEIGNEVNRSGNLVPPGSFNTAPHLSVGSSLHSTGKCRPCAWYWKSGGCKNGIACRHCHTCPEGSVKALKRGKVALLKAGYSPGVMCVLRSQHMILAS